MSEKIPPDDYEKQRTSLESGFRKLSDAEQNNARAEFVALRRDLSKNFNASSPEVTEAKINAFLTSHGATIETVESSSSAQPQEVPVFPFANQSLDAVVPAVEAVQPEGVQSGLEEFADEVKTMLSEKLVDEAEVAGLTITKTPEGLVIRAELHQGMAGKIELDGMLVASGNTLGIEGLNVKADRFEKTVRKKIEENLSDLGTALQSHFEKRYGKPISGIRAGESGFAVDFKAPEETGPEQEAKLEVFQSNRKNIGGAEVVSESQFTPMQMAEIDRIKTQLHELDSKASIRELTTDEFADRANLELELEDIYGPFQEQQEQASFEDKKKYLNGRDKKLGAKAKEFGIKVESHIRNAGEWYRKLPLKYKIGVAGALLGLNVATGGASTFVTLFTGTAMIGQRALGSASVYALIDGLYEKRLQKEEKKRGSDRTKFERWKKRGYSTAAALAVFIGLPGYAIKEGFDAVGGGGLLKALGSLMGHTIPAEVTPVTVPSGVSTDQVADEAKKVLEETKEQLAKEIIERDKIQAGLEQVKQQIAEEKAQVAAEASTPQETRQALRTAVEKITKLTETASAKFEMPKHADFSIHEDDTTISPYDVTPTDQTQAEDILSPEVEEVEEQVETGPASAPEATPAEPLPVEKVSEPVVYQKVEADVLQTAGNVEATPVEVPAPPAEAPVEVPAEAPQSVQASVEAQNTQNLITRLEATPPPNEARSIFDTLFSTKDISHNAVEAAIKIAPHMSVDPSLVTYIEPNTGVIPGPAVFLGKDGGLTVYGAAATGDTYTVQRALAERFASLSGYSVKVLLPGGTPGYELVHPSGGVTVETPAFWNFTYKPPLPVNESVYAFPR